MGQQIGNPLNNEMRIYDMKFTEAQLHRFASPIGKTEEEKCKNAIRMVRDAMKLIGYTDNGKEIRSFETDTYAFALDLSANYGSRKIVLLVQGSYANKTNIPSQSDVDVAVILESTFTTLYRVGATDTNYGFSAGSFSVKELKDEVVNALNKKFNYQGVERHDKCVKVIGNTYRVDADVVPAYRYRDYTSDFNNNPNNYTGGIEIRPDSGGSIVNYPEQHIKLDIVKNRVTQYNFKKCVRIIKNIREQMESSGMKAASSVSSFGLESLLWNVDVPIYTKYPSILRYTFDEVVQFLIENIQKFGGYVEANGIKPLFTDEYGKSVYTKFVSDLRSFYQYDITE
jgi:hypothetical protein